MDELVGRQIIGAINLPPRRIGPFISEFLTVGFMNTDGKIILAVPDGQVPNGDKMAQSHTFSERFPAEAVKISDL